MNQIRFSHFYNKFPRDYQYSKLLGVWPTRFELLSPDMILYDTAYIESGEMKYYPLPKRGDAMILPMLAGSGCGHLWTTIRSRWSKNGGLSRKYADKYEYYHSLIGEIFECKVVE